MPGDDDTCVLDADKHQTHVSGKHRPDPQCLLPGRALRSHAPLQDHMPTQAAASAPPSLGYGPAYLSLFDERLVVPATHMQEPAEHIWGQVVAGSTVRPRQEMRLWL